MNPARQAQKQSIRPPGPDSKLRVKHWVEYLSLISVGWIARHMPMWFAQFMGRCLGDVAFLVLKSHRRVALLNLDQAFGENKSEEEKRRILRACFRHYGRAMVETVRIPNINERNFLKYVDLEKVSMFYDGLKAGNGVILCSAHYGNWEMMNLALGYLKLPLSAMARPIDNPLIHNMIEKTRRRSGNQVIYKHKSVRKLLAALRENRIIGIVNDQDVHDRNRIMADFFGRPAATTPVPAAISYRTGAPIVVGYAIPRGKGRYHLRFEDLIWPDTQADQTLEVQRITTLLNQRLERQIHFQPEYWMWLHRRFKTGEQGESDFYSKPRSA